MNKSDVKRYAKDYGLDPSIINDIYDTLSKDDRLNENDITNLIELICYDYMHLEVQSSTDTLTDKKVNEIMNDEELNEMKIDIIDDEIDRINDLSIDLDSIIEQSILDYLDKKSNKPKDNFFDNIKDNIL